MRNHRQRANHSPTATASRPKPGIWLALLIALGLHVLVLLLPLAKHKTATHPVSIQIELQLTRFEPVPKIADDLSDQPEPHATVPWPVPMDKDESVALLEKPLKTPAPASTVLPMASARRDFEHMNAAEKARLTHTILSSQFITEESATDQLFGKPVARLSSETHKNFHYPQTANLITMLNKPMQQLPFMYKPGLIHFAYEPGMKGDLQRFWDVITPEFGWTTKYGTEVKCKWVLIIAGCGWK